MTTGVWRPNSSVSTENSLPLEDLKALLMLGDEVFESYEQLGKGPWDEVAQGCLASSDVWMDFALTLTLIQTEQLIRALTLLEQRLEWDLGRNSPVITLFKVHRLQKGETDRSLAQWVKSHTENRFLPFGSLL